VLVYTFVFPFIWAEVNDLAPLLAGSILLLVPGRWRWAGYTAVVASYSVLATVLPLRGNTLTAGQQIPYALLLAAVTAGVGLMVYGLTWRAGLAAQLEALGGELAVMAVVRERLRIARDVHDLLGLGLSAIALRTDLIGRLIGRGDAQAAGEIGELGGSVPRPAPTSGWSPVTGSNGRWPLSWPPPGRSSPPPGSRSAPPFLGVRWRVPPMTCWHRCCVRR
jgi:signal transduction histidine kinase